MRRISRRAGKRRLGENVPRGFEGTTLAAAERSLPICCDLSVLRRTLAVGPCLGLFRLRWPLGSSLCDY